MSRKIFLRCYEDIHFPPTFKMTCDGQSTISTSEDIGIICDDDIKIHSSQLM
jgi:hypothetical protein